MKWKGVVVASGGIAAIAAAVLLWRNASEVSTAPTPDEPIVASPSIEPAPVRGVAEDRSDAPDAAPTAASSQAPSMQSADAPASTPPTAATELPDPDRPSEQFMHSRRDDGQHSE